MELLQIAKSVKRLVKSQVTMHSTGIKPITDSIGKSTTDQREDLVRGKGKGLIILLHGVPGVGKTSTAECVAEYTNRPLLSITCGDIGDNATDVQANLEHYLRLAHRWGCVLLLDEADVFLNRRDPRDMQGNAVVSVFLRVLEYYSGILFLTTNRIGTIDEAFKSRIHLSLYYPPLDARQTRKIWEINLDIIKENRPHVELDKGEILEWATTLWYEYDKKEKQQWNGRQIRNACQTIAALAEYDGKSDGNNKITEDHLEAVKQASTDFDRYMWQLYGYDDAHRAKKDRLRRDDYRPESPEPPPQRYEDDYDNRSERGYGASYNAQTGRDMRPEPLSPRGSRRKSVFGPTRPKVERRSPSRPTDREYDSEMMPPPPIRRTTNTFRSNESGDDRRERRPDVSSSRRQRASHDDYYEDSQSDRRRGGRG